MLGTAHRSIAFLVPIQLEINPNINVPNIAPTGISAPIHPASFCVNGPLARGDSFDKR